MGLDNQNAEYARLSLQQDKNKWNVDNNDTAIQNAWYARLKNITVGYTIPSSITSKWKIEKLRFYFSGDNVAEITGLSDGYDPEKELVQEPPFLSAVVGRLVLI